MPYRKKIKTGNRLKNGGPALGIRIKETAKQRQEISHMVLNYCTVYFIIKS